MLKPRGRNIMAMNEERVPARAGEQGGKWGRLALNKSPPVLQGLHLALVMDGGTN